MNISKRNKKVAIARWNKIHAKEKLHILNNSQTEIYKSALCGFLAGDGSVQVRKERKFYHYQLDFFPDDKLMLNTYIKYIQIIYKKTPSVRIRDNVYHVRITSKIIVQDLLQISKFGLTDWEIPKKYCKIIIC